MLSCIEYINSGFYLFDNNNVLRLSEDKISFIEKLNLNYADGSSHYFVNDNIDAISSNYNLFKPLGNADNGSLPIQIINSVPSYNSVTGYWEFQDIIGKRIGQVQEGRCYQFDGTDDYIDWGFGPTTGTEYFEIEMTFQRHDGNINTFCNGDDAFKNRFGVVWYTDDRIRFYVGDGVSSSYTMGITLALTGTYDNEYVTLRTIFDNSQKKQEDKLKLWINNKQILYSNFFGTIDAYNGTPSYNFRTGKFGGDYSNSKFSDIKIYNKNRELIHSWHCDEGNGSIVYDSVGNQNGTLNNINSTTFHITDNHFKSYQNDVGYNLYRYYDSSIPAYLHNSTFTESFLYNHKYKFEFKKVVFKDLDKGILFGVDETDGYFGINSATHYLVLYVYNSDNQAKYLNTTFRPVLGKSYDISIEADSTSAKIWVDGELQVSASGNYSFRNMVSREIKIGSYQKPSIPSINGYMEGFISKLDFYQDDSLLYSWDFTKSLTDTENGLVMTDEGTLNVSVPISINNNLQYAKFDGNSYAYNPNITQTYIHNLGDVEVEVQFEFDDITGASMTGVGGGNPVFGVGKQEFNLAINEDGKIAFSFYNGTSIKVKNSSVVAEKNKIYTCNILLGSGGFKLYIDGSLEVNDGDTSIIRIYNRPLYLGWNGDSTIGIDHKFNGKIYYFEIYKKYKLSSGTLEHSYYFNKSYLDVIGSWDLTHNNVKLIDSLSVGSQDVFLDDEIDYANKVKKSIKIVENSVANFDGTDDALKFDANTLFKPTSAMTIASKIKSDTTSATAGHNTFFRLYLNSNNRFYLSYPGSSTQVVNGTLISLGPFGTADTDIHDLVTVINGASFKFYVDGNLVSEKTGLDFADWDGTTSQLWIGGTGTSNYAFDGLMGDVKVWKNRVFTDDEVKEYYTTQTEPYTPDIYVPLSESGGNKAYEIINDIEGSIINIDSTFWTTSDFYKPTNIINGFDNKIYCASTGMSHFASTDAYGSWEFDIYSNSSVHIWIISQDTNAYPNSVGYFIYPTSTGALYFYKDNGSSGTTLWATSSGYLDLTKNYRIRIERTSSGVFTTYIKGDSFSWDTWTLVSTTGGSNPVTDNTITSSTYFKIELITGNYIENLKINEVTPYDMYSLTVDSGTTYVLRKPTILDSSIGFGNVAGSWHNGAESKLEQYKCPSLYLSDIQLSSMYWFTSTSDDTPVLKDYSDKTYDVNSDNIEFSDAEEDKWKKIINFPFKQTENTLTKINKYINKP